MQAIRSNLVEQLELSDGQNASLLLSRYLKEIKVGEAEQEKAQEARKELFRVAQGAVKDEGVGSLYKAAFESRQKALDGITEARNFKTTSRLIAGLGASSVLETGLTLNPIYGTPMIPGSSLKGIAAHYCSTVLGRADEGFLSPLTEERSKGTRKAGQFYEILFGKVGDNEEESEAGFLNFYDAWILPGSLKDSLWHDVMTPHHSNYYGDNEDRIAPTDFDDPNPVTFLSVKGEFEVRLGCADPQDAVQKSWLLLAFDILKGALEYYGVGGKTRSGYGRMEHVLSPEERERVQKEQYEAEMARFATEAGFRPDGSEVMVRCESINRKHKKPRFKLDGKNAYFEPAEAVKDVEVGEEVRARIVRSDTRQDAYYLERL
ncbi:MAG: type III-B CRISPR module RAMP protein Cmr6 [Fretibacterium sp.]|nr:type III-B CRISPR module RAMP protein Cmr6 [Fretibacterium sp.]